MNWIILNPMFHKYVTAKHVGLICTVSDYYENLNFFVFTLKMKYFKNF